MKRIFAILGMALACSPASAVSLGVANSFNDFIFGNANTPGGHADGSVAVGGSWTMGYNVDQQALFGTVGSKNKIGIYVGGNLTVSNSPSVNNGGNVYVGGTYSGGLNLNGGGAVFTGPSAVDPTVFTTQKTYSLNQSATLKGLGGTAINTSDPNSWSINAASQSGSLKLYTIDASQLSLLRTLDVAGLGSSDTLVINVTGSTVSGFGVTLNSSYYDKILWNFADATSINISDRAFHGSLLAPNAVVNQYQNIDGNLIANSWNAYNSVETHAGSGITFDGNLPSNVPEPGTVGLFVSLSATGGLLLRNRRQQKTQRS